MILGKVIGNVWATKKEEALSGYKLMVVDLIKASGESLRSEMIAVDTIGAGIGDTVIIARGSSSRATGNGYLDAPIDAKIVGIVDEIDA